MQHEHPQATATQDRGALAAVCGEIASLIRQRRGLGPSRCHAYWAGRAALVVLLDDTYTSAEWDLREHGRDEEVLTARAAFNDTAEHDLLEIVERMTGHAPATVLSASHLAPDKTAFVFLLEEPGGRARARIDALMEQASEQHAASRAVLAESRQVVQQTARRRVGPG